MMQCVDLARQVKDSLLADASAALDRLEEILGNDAQRPAPAVSHAVPKGSPGFNLEGREESQDLGIVEACALGSLSVGDEDDKEK